MSSNKFKEDTIYELEKNNPISSSKWFKKDIKDKYGIVPSGDLYRRIVNYQIKNYGKSVTQSDYALGDYKITRKIPNAKGRRNNIILLEKNRKLETFIERVERNDKV